VTRHIHGLDASRCIVQKYNAHPPETLSVDEQYHRLVTVIDRHAGATFRAAFCYDETDWQTLYVREDVATEQLQSVVPALHEQVLEQDPLVPAEVYGGLGATQATVELHDDAVVVHFRESDTTGVVVTLDVEAARDLTEFISECTDVLNP